ncbi:unnamed protein product [Chironomus riparius]|uniref:Uncharacterized protein n=1 Tax=Chironomus riparius TaxID=315576 RepID=A0A9N9RRG2_9DIPT|nr:unnamed protein product [Chironomus riparius]
MDESEAIQKNARNSKTKKRKNSDHDDEPSEKMNEVNNVLIGKRHTLANNKCKGSKDKNDELRKEKKSGKKIGSETSKQSSLNEIKDSNEEIQQKEEEPETSSKEETTKEGRVLRSSRK